MGQDEFKEDGWQRQEYLQVIEEGKIKKVLLNGCLYMLWEEGDELSNLIMTIPLSMQEQLEAIEIEPQERITPRVLHGRLNNVFI